VPVSLKIGKCLGPGGSSRTSAVTFEGGRISRVFAVRNPDKLHRLSEETQLSR